MSKVRQHQLTKEIENLRRETYLSLVCSRAGIKANGCQMEHYFEPEKITKNKRTGHTIRTCKYDRYFSTNPINPSIETILLIENNLHGTAELYTSPIWAVLSELSIARHRYDEIYFSFPLALQCIIFENDTNELNLFVKAPLSSHSIEKISEFGGLHALACLIAIYTDNTSPFELNVTRTVIEKAIYRQLASCCVTGPLDCSEEKLFNIIQDELFKQKPPRFRAWAKGYKAFEKLLKTRRAAFRLAMETGLIRYLDLAPQFLHWLERGKKSLIVKEIKLLKTANPILSANDEQGLAWLINKFKRYYTKSEFQYFRTIHKQFQ